MSFNCLNIFRVRSRVTYRSITKNYCIQLRADSLILSSINFTEKKNQNQWSWQGIWYSVMRVIFPLNAITSSLPGLFVWDPRGLPTSGQCTLERISVRGKRICPLQRAGEVPVQREVGKAIYWRDTVLRHVGLGKEVLPMYPHMWLGKSLCVLRGTCTLILKSLSTRLFIPTVSRISHYAYLFPKGGRNLSTFYFPSFSVFTCAISLTQI